MTRILFIILLAIAGAFNVLAGSLPTDSCAVKDSVVNKGSYVWVPDSLQDDVRKVFSRNYKLEKINHTFNPDEKVIVNGDTVNLYIKERNLGRFSRGLFNYLFIPKGTWTVGLTASYGDFSTEDLQILNLMNDFDFSGHTFSIKPYISYFIKNNLSLGFRLGYTSSLGDLKSLNVNFDDDINFNLKDIKYRSESYTAAIQARQYIGLSRRGRFGVYNEVELAFSSGNSDFTRPYDGKPKVTHTTNMDARLTFSPGLCILVMKNVSFNVSFGVFGYYIHNERQYVDGVKAGDRFSSGANFRFNIFNINFGLAVHI